MTSGGDTLPSVLNLYGFEPVSRVLRWAVEVYVGPDEIEGLLGPPTVDDPGLRSWAVGEQDARLLFALSSHGDHDPGAGLCWSLSETR